MSRNGLRAVCRGWSPGTDETDQKGEAMAKNERQILEEIAVSMVILSMQYLYPEAREEAREQVKELTDEELVSFVTD